MRLAFERIEAESPEAAAAIASDKPTEDADDIDDCNGEDFGALVDVAGDDRYERSVMIDFEAERLRQAAPKLLVALQQIATFTANRDVPSDAALNAVAAIAGRTLNELEGRAA
jgi:hypothetical protein